MPLNTLLKMRNMSSAIFSATRPVYWQVGVFRLITNAGPKVFLQLTPVCLSRRVFLGNYVVLSDGIVEPVTHFAVYHLADFVQRAFDMKEFVVHGFHDVPMLLSAPITTPYVQTIELGRIGTSDVVALVISGVLEDGTLLYRIHFHPKEQMTIKIIGRQLEFYLLFDENNYQRYQFIERYL